MQLKEREKRVREAQHCRNTQNRPSKFAAKEEKKIPPSQDDSVEILDFEDARAPP